MCFTGGVLPGACFLGGLCFRGGVGFPAGGLPGVGDVLPGGGCFPGATCLGTPPPMDRQTRVKHNLRNFVADGNYVFP